MKSNLGALLADQDTRFSEADRQLAITRLLPSVNAGISEVSEQINLAAFGFGGFPGISKIVGPFGLTDIRLSLSQPILNMQSIYGTRAAAANERAARLSAQDARDIVALAVTGLYLRAVTATSRIATAAAQVESAKTVYDQAEDYRKNGLVPAIESLRAQVELQTQQQRLISNRNDADKYKLQLARAIGLPDGQAFDLADALPFSAPPSLAEDAAIARASSQRADFQAASARLDAAEQAKKAADAEHLPTADFNGNYGDIGPNPGSSHGTYSATVSVNVPVFQGDKFKADALRADVELERRKSELADLRALIAYEIRAAYLDISSAAEQLRVAESTQKLADEQLKQARDRFAAGVANNLEVVQAQEAVATANDAYTGSLYLYNAARATLGRSLGNAEKSIPSILQGGQP